jgi:hypothetical protein
MFANVSSSPVPATFVFLARPRLQDAIRGGLAWFGLRSVAACLAIMLVTLLCAIPLAARAASFNGTTPIASWDDTDTTGTSDDGKITVQCWDTTSSSEDCDMVISLLRGGS